MKRLRSAVALVGAFFGGYVAAVVVCWWPYFSIKREIDLIEVSKIFVLAVAAWYGKELFEKRKAAEKSERELLIDTAKQAIALATTCREDFESATTAEPWTAAERSSFDRRMTSRCSQLSRRLSSLKTMLEFCDIDCDESLLEDLFESFVIFKAALTDLPAGRDQWRVVAVDTGFQRVDDTVKKVIFTIIRQ